MFQTKYRNQKKQIDINPFQSLLDSFKTTPVLSRPVVLEISDHLRENLFDFQLKDVEKAVEQKKGRVLFGHEMGCGKTIISITTAYHYKGKVLVICPSYLESNWANELLKWQFTSEDKINLIRKTKQDLCFDCIRVIIISYDLAVRKIKELELYHFETIIVDESHYLKNRKSLRVKTLSNFLKNHSKRLLLLSGTPATNSPRDLFVQLHLLYPEYFKDYFEFSKRYCDGHKGPFGWDDRGASNVQEMNLILKHLMIRRLKKDILKDLPGKIRMKTFLDVKITFSMKKNAKRLLKLNKELAKVGEFAPDHLQKKFNQRLFLISQMFTELSYTKKYAILKFLEDFLNGSAEKFIVFVHHKHVVEAICEFLDKKEIGFVTIDGSTKQELRQDLVNDFVDKSSKSRVAVLSLKACSTGLNFTPVTNIIFAELLYELAVLKQAEDRINRIGCTQTCQYYYLIAKNTIDEKVFSSIQSKSTVIDKIIDNSNSNFNFI